MTENAADLVGGWLMRFAADHPAARVVDIGGGSGSRAVPLALAGCTVLVVDASTDALASLARRAAEADVSDRVTGLQADADRVGDVLPPGGADLVLYHNIVQDVDDPAHSVSAAAGVLRPGGQLSLLVPGRLSRVLGEALAGRPAAALRTLAGDPALDRYYDVPSLRVLMQQAGITVDSIIGIGVVGTLAGYAGRALTVGDPAWAELEQRSGGHPVLGQMAGDLHGVGTRPSE